MNQNTGAIVGIVVIALILLAGGPAFCGGNENKKIKREKAKNTDPDATAIDLYLFMNTLYL
ncbi:hypothetical protein A2949_00620 [Candidatus Adlerbacteria bacterium RIFCSPLOWO2_01_FULL_54_21b]|uniref:Uncharacterized protein n=1 Tax=Candidatus Adlerbacteria bacterium RIFCSPLOWO2_01_FULL_54_21b TaxID=1797245 RepID=A0A1F4Y1I8_9BACT|nr:MAG: hypothetical protein A2949_00620 [Candidatus Adlerbacteria bacterium RIFCSPLOWO2_01_FULL_54_21b]